MLRIPNGRFSQSQGYFLGRPTIRIVYLGSLFRERTKSFLRSFSWHRRLPATRGARGAEFPENLNPKPYTAGYTLNPKPLNLTP